MFSSQDDQKMVESGCRAATMGCVDCKKTLHTNLNNFIAPIRERYHELMKDPDQIRDILASGAQKASILANETLERVYDLVGYRF